MTIKIRNKIRIMSKRKRKMTPKLIPVRERWLFRNPAAKALVNHGLSAAAACKFAEPPDLGAAPLHLDVYSR